MAHIIADLYVKIEGGKRITIAEAEALFTHMDELQLMLYQLGPIFVLAAREAHRVRDKLELYIKERKFST